jgi:hypothetical protein
MERGTVFGYGLFVSKNRHDSIPGNSFSMLYRDPKCVFVADNFGQADIVANWLDEHGIPAQVMNQATLGGLVSPLLTPAVGVEVWVVDPAHAPEAIRLLGERALADVAKERTGAPVAVVCEECGASSTFPASCRDTVQDCPHCSAFLDVVDPDEDDGAAPVDEFDNDDESSPGNDGITDRPPGGLKKP